MTEALSAAREPLAAVDVHYLAGMLVADAAALVGEMAGRFPCRMH